MDDKKITNDIIAGAMINFTEKNGICDKDTALGFKKSKKKEILKSKKDGSFSKFICEIKKRQNNKEN